MWKYNLTALFSPPLSLSDVALFLSLPLSLTLSFIFPLSFAVFNISLGFSPFEIRHWIPPDCISQFPQYLLLVYCPPRFSSRFPTSHFITENLPRRKNSMNRGLFFNIVFFFFLSFWKR